MGAPVVGLHARTTLRHSHARAPPTPHRHPQGTGTFPLKSLRTFTRTRNLAPGASQTLQLPLRTSDFAVPREDGASVVRLGEWRVAVGPLSEVVRVTKPQLDLTANTIGWAAQSPASA